MIRTAAFAAALVTGALAARAGDVPKTVIVPAGTERSYDNWHYAPAVRVGDTVWASGIPASGAPTYEGRIRRMFERTKAVLKDAGADMADVVELTTFHRDAKDTEAFRKEFEEFLKVHKEFFPENYPAWTAVGTTSLLAPDAPVEMKVVAVIGAGKNAKVQRSSPSPSPKD